MLLLTTGSKLSQENIMKMIDILKQIISSYNNIPDNLDKTASNARKMNKIILLVTYGFCNFNTTNDSNYGPKNSQ